MTTETQNILKELRQRLEALYGERLERLVLFGSRARGEAEEDSDIDVLVVLKGAVDLGTEVHQAGRIFSDLSLKHNTVISPVFVSSKRYETGQSPLLLNVRREGVRI
ncbi:nucleotidyltransferase domain-containing protein [bacterium]|nr:nucleotidyltransferase domain-containing protein [bacterium]MBU1936396.1 nucleotidyltransferase domain-containing protein [bacterium]